MIASTSLSAQRRIVEECLKWANQRVVFGKPLNSQPVIRARLASMIARVEAAQNWLEFITHQMNNVCPSLSLDPRPVLTPSEMSYNEQSDKLAGPIGLLKQYGTPSSGSSRHRGTHRLGPQIHYKNRPRNRGRCNTHLRRTRNYRYRHGQARGKRMCFRFLVCYVPLTLCIPQYHRTSPYDAILGGAEDVLGDLGVRQALRKMPKNARL